MANCKVCGQNMQVAGSCTQRTVTVDSGQTFDRIPYGDPRTAIEGFGEPERCHDCNVAAGGIHHRYCDNELCPACGGQLISCGCVRSWLLK
jgi:hypothetical protein